MTSKKLWKSGRILLNNYCIGRILLNNYCITKATISLTPEVFFFFFLSHWVYLRGIWIVLTLADVMDLPNIYMMRLGFNRVEPNLIKAGLGMSLLAWVACSWGLRPNMTYNLWLDRLSRRIHNYFALLSPLLCPQAVFVLDFRPMGWTCLNIRPADK